VDRATAVLGVDPADTTHARPVSGATAVLRSVAHNYTLLMAIVLVVIIVIAVVELAQ
jgi:hypothetical protein